MSTPMSDWKWFGKAGHFICGHLCQHHLCTQVGAFLVSTVGDYHPDMNRIGDRLGPQRTIGCDRTHETYVFRVEDGRCECGCGLPNFDKSEIDSLSANSDAEADQNHITMCRKYAE